jgi:hypothetical protein
MKRTLPLILLLSVFIFSSVAAQIEFEAQFPVLAGNDDAEEKINTGAMDIGSTDLEMTRESSDQLIGLRFNALSIPRGATIRSAYIQFTVDETDDEPTNLIIHGEMSAQASPFSTTAFNISQRERTVDSVIWSNIPAWNTENEAGPDQRTPDLSSLIEAIINQPNWEAGNAAGFIISGTGRRNAISYNKSSEAAPTLVVTYDVVDFPIDDFPFGAERLWKYDDSGTPLDTADWTSLSYDDTDWAFGQAKLGYGDDNERTTLDFGADPDNKITTYYFRKTFNVNDAESIDSVTVNLLRDDGAIVYLNGEEIARSNMPAGPVDFNTFASETVAGSEENQFFSFKIGNEDLENGSNVIAVEVHQATANSSDLGFDLSVTPEIILPPQIQLIHNSPDPSLAAVSVYVDLFSQGIFVNITGSDPVPFRFATPFLSDLPAGEHQVAISPFGQSDFMWNATPITLESNKRYVIMVSGVRTPADFDTSVNSASDIAFQIQVGEVPFEEEVSAGEAFLMLDHGTPDLPNIRLIAPGVGDATADLPEGLPLNFPLLGGEVPAFDFPLIQVTDNLTTEIFGEYSLGLLPFSGQVVTVVTSGFFTTENNSGVDDPNFGTFFIPNTGGPFIPLAEPTPPVAGTIEIIHESPDPGLDSVDIYVNGELAIQGLRYRESTGRISIPAGSNRIAVSPSGIVDSTWSAQDVFIDFALNSENLLLEGFDYSCTAYGLRDTAGFGNRVNADIDFKLALSQARTEAANPANVDILFFHGSPNAPTVDFIIDGQFIPLVNDLPYGQFSPIYASLPADESYQLNITAASDNDQIVKAYQLDLTGLSGEVLTLSASGMLGGTPPFGLFQSDGSSSALTPLDEIIISQVTDARAAGFEFYPNPVRDQLYVEGPAQKLEIMDTQGRVLCTLHTGGSTRNELDISAYPAGTYFLRIFHVDGHHSVTIMKQ